MQSNPAFINNIYVDKRGEKIHDNRPFAYILSSKRNIGINLSTHSSSWESFYIITVVITIDKKIYLIILVVDSKYN